MPLIVNSPIVQFADDVKMFKTIVAVNDYLQLQHNINLLMVQKWQLKLTFSKCYLLHLHGQAKACDFAKDLGVPIDSILKFRNHTTVVTKKANHLVAIIQKTFQHFDKVTKSVLEYGSIIYGPQCVYPRPAGNKESAQESNQINPWPSEPYMMIDWLT